MHFVIDSVKYTILFHTEIFNSLILTQPMKKKFIIFPKWTFRNLILQEIAEIYFKGQKYLTLDLVLRPSSLFWGGLSFIRKYIRS